MNRKQWICVANLFLLLFQDSASLKEQWLFLHNKSCDLPVTFGTSHFTPGSPFCLHAFGSFCCAGIGALSVVCSGEKCFNMQKWLKTTVSTHAFKQDRGEESFY